MKTKYKLIIFVIIVLLVGALLVVSFYPREICFLQRLSKNATAVVPSLAALLAAFIALSATDPRKDKVKVHIHKPYIDTTFSKWQVRYHHRGRGTNDANDASQDKEYVQEIEFTNDQEDFYKNCPRPIKSYVVQFKITNKSRICLNRPVVTFWVPAEKQTPGEKGTFELRSNLYNSQADLRILQMAREVMISNSNLPYWPDERDMTIWIRIVLENKRNKGDPDDFEVQVSINSENAIGFTEKVKLDPKELLKDM